MGPQLYDCTVDVDSFFHGFLFFLFVFNPHLFLFLVTCLHSKQALVSFSPPIPSMTQKAVQNVFLHFRG